MHLSDPDPVQIFVECCLQDAAHWFSLAVRESDPDLRAIEINESIEICRDAQHIARTHGMPLVSLP